MTKEFVRYSIKEDISEDREELLKEVNEMISKINESEFFTIDDYEYLKNIDNKMVQDIAMKAIEEYENKKVWKNKLQIKTIVVWL